MPGASPRRNVEDMTTDARAQRRPLSRADWQFDVLLAIVMFVGGLISTALSAVAGFYGEEQQANTVLALVYVAMFSLPLALRRRWPSTVAVVVSVAYFAGTSFRIPEMFAGSIAMFIALYTVGAWSTHRQRARIVRIALIIGMFAWLIVVMFIEATAPTDDGVSRIGTFSPFVALTLINLLFNALYFGGAYFLGDRAWNGALQRQMLEERTAELEAEREVTAAQAVALDRVRIARELHDVVAHHVSAMGVQAGAARAVMDVDPELAREALQGVESSARAAIADLQQLLQTLRTSSDVEGAASTLSLDALPALVEAVTAAGMPTTLTIVGEPAAVAQLVQVNLYRITQEALTNARRHGGPGTSADVRVRYGGAGVEVEITNAGRATSYAARGMGQIGMGERATVVGGTLEFGPRSGERGGYLVRVSVPLGARADARGRAGTPAGAEPTGAEVRA